MTVRPRRSVLYMPGSNARALDKAKTLPADGVILDLEDLSRLTPRRPHASRLLMRSRRVVSALEKFLSGSMASIRRGMPTIFRPPRTPLPMSFWCPKYRIPTRWS